MAAAPSAIGHMDPYDDSPETFNLYLERFDMFSVANFITEEEKMKATFLSLIGAKTYSLLHSLPTPDKPKNKGFTDPAKLLKRPPVSSTLGDCGNISLLPTAGETTNPFIAQLNALSTHCNFYAGYR